MICPECQAFIGQHTHNETYHLTGCECNGSDWSRTVMKDPAVQTSVLLAASMDESMEREGKVISAKDYHVWPAVFKRIMELMK